MNLLKPKTNQANQTQEEIRPLNFSHSEISREGLLEVNFNRDIMVPNFLSLGNLTNNYFSDFDLRKILKE
jgi:hypothetical protein